jgi:DNA-binding transcriptional LysR family regulator
MQIREIEKEIGTAVFERGGKRKIELTPAGRMLLDGARQTLLCLERATQNAKSSALGQSGALHAGYTEDFLFCTTDGLGSVFQKFQKAAPAVNLEMTIGRSYQVMESIESGDFDLGLLPLPIPQFIRNIVVHQLPNIEIVAVVSLHHPLAAQKKIWLKDLSDTPLHLSPYHMISAYATQVARLLTSAKVTPRVVATSDNTIIQLQAISLGVGATLATLSSIPPNWKGIKILRLKDESPHVEVGIAYRKDSHNLLLIKQFIEVTETTLKNSRTRALT